MSLPELNLSNYEVTDFFSIVGDSGPDCKCDYCGRIFICNNVDGMDEHLRNRHFKAVTKAEAEF